jgi:hypothetical protein
VAEFQPKQIFLTLLEHDVDFVLIGGLAGVARGSSYPTYDVRRLVRPMRPAPLGVRWAVALPML